MKISIITINYNNRDGLQKTIESVIGQTYTDYEYIIIDGGSTDGSIDIINQYKDRIIYWVSEPDKGIYNAMNKGILKTAGEYCNFMNSGDYFYNNSVLEKFFAQKVLNEDIIFGKYVSSRFPEGSGFSKPDLTMLDLCRTHPNHQSSFIKKKLFENTLYDESLKLVSDWKFFIEAIILQNCTVRIVDEIIAYYDLNGLSEVNHKAVKEEHDRVLREFLPERIYQDYIYLVRSDSTLLELTPYFNKTRGFQKFIYKIVYLLIRIYKFIKR